jgi:hypothetical protein
MKLSFVTTNRTSDLPQRSGSFQAMVRAGDSLTSYLRTGKGAPVILLRRATHDARLWELLLGDVSSAFRVILPEHAPHGAEFGSWFRSFLDGLGLGAVQVVADAHYGLCCIDAELLEPDWIRVLIVVSNADEHAQLRVALDARAASGVSTAVHVLHADNAPEAIAAHTLQLLRRD